MKRIIAIILSIAILLTGCSIETMAPSESNDKSDVTNAAQSTQNGRFVPAHTLEELQPKYLVTPAFSGMSDPSLLSYMEDDIYYRLLAELDTDKYYIQDINAVYVSKEYLEESAYNSQANVYFGYTLAELDNFFGDTKYAFTVGEDGQTTVVPIQNIADEGFTDEMLLNLAIGTGVILVCVVICVVSDGAGAPAAAAIFAASAKTGAICALSGGLIAGVTSGALKGYQTGDFNEALKAAAVSGSEGYKWGAIGGAVSGGASEAIALHGATANGLTMNQVAQIQKESRYPLQIIKQFHSVEEYNVFKNAGLTPFSINGRTILINPDIDLYTVDSFGKTNLERMLAGRPPITSTGEAIDLHHIGQNNDGVLAMLTKSDHQKFYKILHPNGNSVPSGIDRAGFDVERPQIWKTFGNLLKEMYIG